MAMAAQCDGGIFPHDAKSVSNILKHDVIVLLGCFGQDAEGCVNPNQQNRQAGCAARGSDLANARHNSRPYSSRNSDGYKMSRPR